MRLKQLAVSLAIAVVGTCALTHVVDAQTNRQELIAKVKEVCHDTRGQIEETQLPALEERSTAFNAFAVNWQTKMPPPLRDSIPKELQEGLKGEKDAVKRLFINVSSLQKVLRRCEAVTDDETSHAQLSHQAEELAAQLKSLEKDLEQRKESRRSFKTNLNKAVDLMIQQNTSNLGTYIKIKVALDPDGLDMLVMHQGTLLLPAQVALKVLK